MDSPGQAAPPHSASTTSHRGPVPVPRLPGHPVLGCALDLQRDPLSTLRRAERLGPVVRLDAGPPGWRHVLYGVFSPDGAEHVLVDQAQRYTKDTPQYAELRAAMGDGIFTSEGATWHRQRRFVAPVLTRRRILRSYAPAAVEEMERVADRWERAGSGATVDVHTEMVGFTVRFILRVLLGVDVEDALRVLHDAAPGFNQGVRRRSASPHPLPVWVPTGTNRRLRSAVRAHRSLVHEVIARRRASGADGDDLLGLLLAARDPHHDGTTADALSDGELTDQVLAFLLAGHETTATTLALALLRLAAEPHWQHLLQQEVDDVVGDRAPTAADLPRLVWTDRVVREVLRMWPSAPTTVRRTPDGDTVLGRRLPPGAVVLVSPYATHHSPQHWHEPDRFDPGRFDDPLPGGHRYAWIPFGAGPHACIGAQLAMVETVLGLTVLLQRFGLGTDLPEPPIDVGIVLRPSRSLPVRLTLRR